MKTAALLGTVKVRMQTSRRLRAVATIALLILVLGVAFLPYFREWRFLADWDMALHYGMLLAAYRSVIEFGELPFWNPFLGGGHPNLYFPETFIAAPHFLFSYIEPLLGIKLGLPLAVGIGLAGAYQLAGLRFDAVLVRCLVAITYAFSGFHLSKMTVGMLWSPSGMLIPWAVWSFLRALQTEQLRYRIGFAVAIMWMLLGGGVYYLVYTALALCIIVIANLKKMTRRRWLALLEMGVVTLGVSCLKLLPSLAIMGASKRQVDTEAGGSSVLGLWYGLVSERVTRLDIGSIFGDAKFGFWRGFSHDFDENCLYLSLLGVLLLLIGLVRPEPDPEVGDRPTLSNRALFGLLAVSLYAALGENLGAFSFAVLTRDLPIFSTMRLPHRALIIAVLVIPLFVGFGLQNLGRRLPDRARMPIEILVLVVQLGLLLRFHYILYERNVRLPVPALQPVVDFRHVPESRNLYEVLNAGQANPTLAATFGLGTRVLNVGRRPYRGEYFFADSEAIPELMRWSPSRIVLKLPKHDSRLLIVNQFYEPSWLAQDQNGAPLNVVSVRRIPRSKAGKVLGVELDSTTTQATLSYEPRYASAGLWVFLATCAGVGVRVAAGRWRGLLAPRAVREATRR